MKVCTSLNLLYLSWPWILNLEIEVRCNILLMIETELKKEGHSLLSMMPDGPNVGKLMNYDFSNWFLIFNHTNRAQ